MTLRQILILILAAGVLVAVAALFLGIGSDVETRPLGVLSVVFYAFVLICILLIKKNNFSVIAEALVLFSIVWVFIRSVHLSLDVNYFTYGYMVEATFLNFAYTVFMISLFTIFFAAGIYLGTSSGVRYVKNINYQPISKRFKSFILIYAVIILLVQLFLTQTRYREGGSWFLGVASIIFSLDILMLVLFSYFVSHWRMLSGFYKNLFFLLMASYVTLRVLQGSKGGLFVIFTCLSFAWIALRGRQRIPKRYLCLGGVLFLVAVVLFFVGHGIRLFMQSFSGEDFSINLLLENFDVFIGFVLLDYRVGYSSDSPMLEMLFRRLSMLDYMYVMFNREPVEAFISPGYQLQVIFNVILPGTPFSDAHLFSALLFKAAYGYQTYAEVAENYHSDMLPLFGYLFVNFGMFSFVILAAMGFFVGAFFKAVSSFKSRYWWFYKVLFLYMFVDLVFGMGIDNWVQFILFFFLISFVFLRVAFFCYCGIFSRKTKRIIYETQTVNFHRAT